MKKNYICCLILIIMFAVTVSFASTENHRRGNALSELYLINQEKNEEDIEKPIVTIRKPDEFNLPTSVMIIEDEAFEGAAIVNIDMPETLTQIGECAFANINTLRYVRIPLNTRKIANSAFKGSDGVTIFAPVNSYAQIWAKTKGVSFMPIATFCASTSGVTIGVFRVDRSHETIIVNSTDIHETKRKWRRFEEKGVTAILDIICSDILGRGPPKG